MKTVTIPEDCIAGRSAGNVTRSTACELAEICSALSMSIEVLMKSMAKVSSLGRTCRTSE